jgi:DNA-binding response OmpR family regulator
MLMMLRRLGYFPDLAENGLEATKTIENQHYDIVIMDIMMPEMDCLKATMAIRARWPPGEQPYIIAITACSQIYNMKLYINAGVDDYLTKPFSMDELQIAIGKYQAK